MIRRKQMLVITFETTTRAMAMEACCREEGAPGRLIPVPRSITAGCGLAWCAPPETRELLGQLMVRRGIQPQNMTVCLV